MGWIGRSEKKHKKKRAKQRKAESRGEQQQVEKSIGEEVAGKAAGRWRDLRRRVEVHVVYHARMGGVYDLAIRLKIEQEAKRELEQEAKRAESREEQQQVGTGIGGEAVYSRSEARRSASQVDQQNSLLCGETRSVRH